MGNQPNDDLTAKAKIKCLEDSARVLKKYGKESVIETLFKLEDCEAELASTAERLKEAEKQVKEYGKMFDRVRYIEVGRKAIYFNPEYDFTRPWSLGKPEPRFDTVLEAYAALREMEDK